jgi:hypothetical protein
MFCASWNIYKFCENIQKLRIPNYWRDNIKAAMEAKDLAEEDCYRKEMWRLGAKKWRLL